VPTISWLLVKGFFWRMKEKYVIRDFHPLVLFYMVGLLLLGLGTSLGLVETALRLVGNPIPVATVVLVALLSVSGLQLLLFAMWFDMESNKHLHASGLGLAAGLPAGTVVIYAPHLEPPAEVLELASGARPAGLQR